MSRFHRDHPEMSEEAVADHFAARADHERAKHKEKDMGMSDRHYDGGSTHPGTVHMTCPNEECEHRWEARAHIIASGGCEVLEADEDCPECGTEGEVE